MFFAAFFITSKSAGSALAIAASCLLRAHLERRKLRLVELFRIAEERRVAVFTDIRKDNPPPVFPDIRRGACAGEDFAVARFVVIL
jgi:hypothetical protein